jgi:hypothetical protein
LTDVNDFKEHDMRVPVLPMFTSLVLLATPAFAQTNSPTGSNPDQSYSNSSTTGGSTYSTPPGYSNNGMTGGSTYSNKSGASSSGATGSYSQPTGANSASASNRWQNRGDVTVDTKNRIRQSLVQSGFRDVQVMPEAFIIRAQAPDGSHVVMLLRPDEVTGVIEQTGSSTAPNNWNNGSNSASGWNGWSNSGSNENGANR